MAAFAAAPAAALVFRLTNHTEYRIPKDGTLLHLSLSSLRIGGWVNKRSFWRVPQALPLSIFSLIDGLPFVF